MSVTTIQRRDMKDLENEPGAAWTSFARAQTGEAGGVDGLVDAASSRLAFLWGLTPYTEVALFDGDQLALPNVGLELAGRYNYQCNVTVIGPEPIEVFERSYRTTQVQDDCASPDKSFTNMFWIEGAETIWKSRQWVSLVVGRAEMLKL